MKWLLTQTFGTAKGTTLYNLGQFLKGEDGFGSNETYLYLTIQWAVNQLFGKVKGAKIYATIFDILQKG